MSIKKLFGKVAVGAAVGALVIAGAAVVSAQNVPIITNPGFTGTNGMLDGSATTGWKVSAGSTAKLSVGIDLAARAYLYAIPAAEHPRTQKWAGYNIDTVSKITGTGAPIGNVGRLFVQTNMGPFDIVAGFKNGGRLMKNVPDEDRAVASWIVNCVGQGSPLSPDYYEVCDSTAKYAPAPYLQIDDGVTPGATEDAVLDVAVGILKYKSAGDLLSEIDSDVDLEVELDVRGAAPTATTADSSFIESYVSFAVAFGDEINNHTLTSSRINPADSLQAYSKTKVAWSGTPTWDIEAQGFPAFEYGGKLGIHELIDGIDAETKTKAANDLGMQFFINAKLADNLNSDPPTLRGNKFGVYTEDIIFAFYGLW